MSVRSNGSGDNLLHAASWGVSTGTFSMGIWLKIINPDRNTYQDWFGFGNTASGPTDYISCGTLVDGTSIANYTTAGTVPSTQYAASTETWYWVVVARHATNGMWLRVFDDSTSTTPLFSDDQSDSEDFSALDNFVIGQMFGGGTPEWADAEFANAKVHNGVTWTDAECRTESQNFEVQTAGGTVWGSWRLEDVDADSDGLNDGSGNGRNLTNTGFVAGASRPTQLEAVGGGGGGGGFVPDEDYQIFIPSRL